MKIQLASDLHLEFLERRFPGEPIIEPATGADLWLHGHVHDSFDYSDVGRCRVVANPAGYVKNLGLARNPCEFELENAQFNKSLVLELTV